MQGNNQWSNKEIKKAWQRMEADLARELPVAKTVRWDAWSVLLLLFAFGAGLASMYVVLSDKMNTKSATEYVYVDRPSTKGFPLPIYTYTAEENVEALSKDRNQKKANSASKDAHENKKQGSKHIRTIFPTNEQYRITGTAEVDKPLMQIEDADHQIQYEKTTNEDRLSPLSAIDPSLLMEGSGQVNILLTAVPTFKKKWAHLFLESGIQATLNQQLLNFRNTAGLESRISPQLSFLNGFSYNFGYLEDHFTEKVLNDDRSSSQSQEGPQTDGQAPKYVDEETLQYNTMHSLGFFTGMKYRITPKFNISTVLGTDYVLAVSIYEDVNILNHNNRQYISDRSSLNKWQLVSRLQTDYQMTPSLSLGVDMGYQFTSLYKNTELINRSFNINDALSIGLRSRYIF